jgi:beta-glucanase (GH16 family)
MNPSDLTPPAAATIAQRTVSRLARRRAGVLGRGATDRLHHPGLGIGLLAGLLALACGKGPTPTRLWLSPSTITLGVGQTRALSATVTYDDGTTRPIATGLVFSSDHPEWATVSAAGAVQGISAGAAMVTATTLDLSATVAVHVSAPSLLSVEVRPDPLLLAAGASAQLTLTGRYDVGAARDLTAGAAWTAADPNVVSVSTTGLVTGLRGGSTTLTGSSGDGASTRSATIPVEVSAGAGAGYDPSAGWNLVWSDEFAGAAVDPATWTFDIGSGGWGNNESEYYRAENAAVAGGFLTITAREEAFGDARYTSARLQTSQKRAFTYGKFSMRAKLPYSQAMWPAFWLLGANSSSFNLYGGNVAWPGCGEADIMEMVGGLADGSGDFTTHGALHYLDASGRNPGPSAAYRHTRRLSEDFHVYELIWTPHSFTWLFDGLAFGTRVITADMEEFTRPMFILLNLAIGGPWGGWVDASTVFPQTYVIDYVRVYANATTEPGGAPGLATSWHLLGTPAAGVTPAGETLASTPGTVTGFQPTRALTAPATWYSTPLTGSYEAGAWSVGIFTTNPAAASVLQVEVFKTAADGSGATSLGSARLDVSATGGGNHRSWFALTGVPVEHFADQRLKVVVTPVSGATATMIYNGNDFDSVVATPWSAAGP